MTSGFCRRKKLLMRFSSPSVVTVAAAGSVPRALSSSAAGCLIGRLAVERELEVARQVLVARDTRASHPAGVASCVTKVS